MAAEESASVTAPELAAALERSRRSLMDTIGGLNDEGFRARSEPSAWTPAEVLAHLLADETKLTGYARTALDTEGLSIPGEADEERDKQPREAARRMPVPQIVHGLVAARRDTRALLDSLSDGQLERQVRHPSYDRTNVARLFQHIAEHEEEHAAQIRFARVEAASGSP